MYQISMYVLITAVVVSLTFQIAMIIRMKTVYNKLGGVIRTNWDLKRIKSVINLSMKLAIFYIVFFAILIIILIYLYLVKIGIESIIVLFFFGISILPFGILGRYFEKKIKTMKVDAKDPQIEERYNRYIEEWNKARFQLSD
jgi:hypothetical protein